VYRRPGTRIGRRSERGVRRETKIENKPFESENDKPRRDE
jgi:hypothetical protein